MEKDVISEWGPLPLLLGTKEVSRVTGYCEPRIREMCRAGLIPHIKWGRAYRIPKESLRIWILEQAKTPAGMSRGS